VGSTFIVNLENLYKDCVLILSF